ncbi:hypothetical protein MMC30_003635 [Trapelia coarctata]|nr:hypothetical protein [Trapelia coarctata]
MHRHEQAPHILTWSSHTLAATSLLLARIKSHARIAAGLTANIPSIGYGNCPFTVQNVEAIEEYLRREKPNWTEDIAKMKADTENKDIDKAVEYLEKGMLKTDRVFLPVEASCQRGLENLTKVIIELAGGAQQFDEPVKEEWNGRIDLVTPDAKGSNAGRIHGDKYHEGGEDHIHGHGHGFGHGGAIRHWSHGRHGHMPDVH